MVECNLRGPENETYDELHVPQTFHGGVPDRLGTYDPRFRKPIAFYGRWKKKNAD
jgi:hypothetical protein